MAISELERHQSAAATAKHGRHVSDNTRQALLTKIDTVVTAARL
jgi:hypothetical protein